MTTSKGFANVQELLKGIGADPAFAKSVEDELQARSISRALVVLRHKSAMTQAEVATRMEVKQSTVSKMERSRNSDLGFGAIESYLHAVGGQMNITVMHGNHTLANQVKIHVGQIHRLLLQLAELTKKDESLGVHVAHFFGEALYNMFRVMESASSHVHGVTRSTIEVDTDCLVGEQVGSDSVFGFESSIRELTRT